MKIPLKIFKSQTYYVSYMLVDSQMVPVQNRCCAMMIKRWYGRLGLQWALIHRSVKCAPTLAEQLKKVILPLPVYIFIVVVFIEIEEYSLFITNKIIISYMYLCGLSKRFLRLPIYEQSHKLSSRPLTKLSYEIATKSKWQYKL